jgi:integral membrane sensor domain MASE1
MTTASGVVLMGRPLLFRPSQTPRSPLLAPGFAGAYIVLAILAYAWTTSTAGLAVLWICTGVMAAGLLLLPARSAVAVAAICMATDFVAAIFSGASWPRALLISACDMSEAVVAAVLIRRYCGAGLDMNKLTRFRNFVLMAALSATVGFGILGALLSSLSFGDKMFEDSVVWVVGDFLGMMIGTPTALLLARFSRYEGGATASAPERAILITLVVAVAGIIFSLNQPQLLYALFPIGLLVIIRLSTPYAALAVLIIAFIASGATVTGQGRADPADLSHHRGVLRDRAVGRPGPAGPRPGGAAPGPDGRAVGAPRGRGRGRRQGSVPGRDEPRDAHAAQRHRWSRPDPGPSRRPS